MPTVRAGLGTTLSHGVTGTPVTYTAIAEIVEIKGPGIEWGKVSTTNLSSTVKTERPTLPDCGSVEFKIQWDPSDTNHQIITDIVKASSQSATDYWKITFTDTSDLPFTGFVEKFEPSGMVVEGNLEADITIKVNSMPTFPTGS